MQSNPKINSF